MTRGIFLILVFGLSGCVNEHDIAVKNSLDLLFQQQRDQLYAIQALQNAIETVRIQNHIGPIVATTERVSWDFRDGKSQDTHGVVNRNSQTAIAPVSGHYVIEDCFKAGDVIRAHDMSCFKGEKK